MPATPFGVCAGAAETLGPLRGLRIGAGWNKRVRELLGGAASRPGRPQPVRGGPGAHGPAGQSTPWPGLRRPSLLPRRDPRMFRRIGHSACGQFKRRLRLARSRYRLADGRHAPRPDAGRRHLVHFVQPVQTATGPLAAALHHALADSHRPSQAFRHSVLPRLFTQRSSRHPRCDRNAGPCMDRAGRRPVALEHSTADGTGAGDPADAVRLEQLCRGQAMGRPPARRHLRPAEACADVTGPGECAPTHPAYDEILKLDPHERCDAWCELREGVPVQIGDHVQRITASDGSNTYRVSNQTEGWQEVSPSRLHLVEQDRFIIAPGMASLPVQMREWADWLAAAQGFLQRLC